MTVLRLSSVSPSIVDISSDQLAEQLEALLDSLRRQYGNAEIARSGLDNVLLATQYALYVNPEIGCDDYVAGNYNADKKILNQEYHCGYSPYRPFKTLARAYAEVARRSILAGPSNDIYDRAVIFVDLTDLTLFNGRGAANVTAWNPGPITTAQLNALNDATRPGLIHPRGVSVIGRDLRRSVIRPSEVPQGSDNAITGRFPMFRVTGGSYFCNFTVKDKLATPRSHHLVHSHEFCSQADLLTYYSKIQTIFGLTGAEVINPGETEIVAPAPDGDATEATDSVAGASPYIFGCSLRSEYGLCGPLLDGRVVSGFKSMEAAQYTIISLQKDWSAYERYTGGQWVQVTDFADYLATNINDIRYRIAGNQDLITGGTYTTDYRHFGFKFIGDAFIQEVSEFVISAAVHHWGGSGSIADLSNCNSAFGGSATLAHGFRGITTAGGALPQDKNFVGIAVRRPLQIKTDGSNVKQIGIGRVAPTDGYVEVLDENDNVIEAYIQLEFPFDPTELLLGNSASLKENHYIWISNSDPSVGPGADPINGDGEAIPVRARLAAVPWTADHPDRIYVKPTGTNNIIAVEEGQGTALTTDDLAGNLVYLRRLVDSRLPEQREYSLIVANASPGVNRRPQGNFVLRLGDRSSRTAQLDPANGSDELYLVSEATRIALPNATPGTNYYKVLIRPGDAGTSYSNTTFYRPAVPVGFGSRVFRSIATQKGAQPDGDTWVGANLQFSSPRGIEWPRSQAGPRLVLDKDISPDPNSLTLGINFNTDADYLDQLRSSTDFQALARLMVKLGYNANDLGSAGNTMAGKILAPQPSTTRDWNPEAGTSPVPAGKLTARAAWPLEFNLPTTIEARNQIFRYIGLLNYSKALPKYQRSVLNDQYKLDAVSTSMFGGRSYADGSIENGLTIQGDRITDLSTGRDFTTESIGIGALSEINTQISNTLLGDYLLTGNLDVQEDLTIGGDLEVLGSITQATFGPGVLPAASRTDAGIVRLATPTEVATLEANNVAVTPADLTTAVSSAIKNVMSVRLSLSGATPVPVETQTGSNLFLHPYGGNDVALFNPTTQRWQLLQLTQVRSYSLSTLALPNIERNYDIYLYNAGTSQAPDLQLELVVWPADRTPPARGSRDGVLMKAGDLSRRLIGVVRVLADGSSRIDLGGVITGAQSANYPRVFLANLYNIYECAVRYWLGSSWNSNSQTTWGPPPAATYAVAPRIAWVQASDLLATAYLSIYNDQISGTPLGNVYVQPGFNSTVLPSADAFSAESQSPNTTVISPWGRSVSAGFHELYYLWLVRPGGNSIVNQHTNNGILAMLKV